MGLGNKLRLLSRPEYRGLTISTVIAAFLVLAGLSLYLTENYQHRILEAQREANNLSHLLEVQTTGTIRGLQAMLSGVGRAISRDVTAAGQLPHLDEKGLTREISRFPEMNALRIFDRDGHCVQATDLPNCKIDIHDREFFIEHASNSSAEIPMTKPLISRADGRWIFILSQRISDSRGQFAGVVLVDVPLKDFERLYSKVDVGAHGNISIFQGDEKALLIRYPPVDKAIGQSFSHLEFFKALTSPTDLTGVVRTRAPIDGLDRLYSFRKVVPLNLTVIVGLAETDFLHEWKLRSAGLCVLSLLIISSMVYFLLRHSHDQADLHDGRVQLERSAKMAALGEMASAVAHEINNPLAIIGGNAEMLREMTESSESENLSVRKRVETIERMVARIAKIVQGLRAFAREGEDDPFETSSIQQVIDQTLDLCRSKIERHQIQLKLEYLDQNANELECKSVQLSQVLLNLIGNACDAVAGLEDRWITVRVQTVGKCYRISVVDSGKGIASTVVDKIMNPFFTTKAVGQGTGLGLSISKGLIEAHSGTLEYDRSSPNTCFVITIPIRRELVTDAA